MSSVAAIGTEHRLVFVRTAPAPSLPPPFASTGVIGWTRANLFGTPFNAVMTVLVVLLFIWVVPPLVRFLLVDAVWTGSDRQACLATVAHPEVGACWAFVREHLAYFTYGSYPIDGRWRVDIFFAMLAVGMGWLLWLNAPHRGLGALYFFGIFPIVSFFLLYGLPALGLEIVDTSRWGGLMVTVVVAAVGIVFSLPLGILLALGRRSHMPALKTVSVVFIEFVRGVPLVTVLFMASVMLPLFLPPAWSPDKLVRALVGVALFSSAYMAEVVRAGLQAIPRGQWEAASALGLGYWQTLRFVVLPPALRITIPNILNTYVGLFKDTTLVFFVGIYDFLKTIEAAREDPTWATPVTSVSGYAFAALFYFTCCYSMSRYATSIERRLGRSERR
ncbi:MAG TPA: amino acid ABC transporter permease [Xanthobacteraceae bacterium]|nr:amino acid ABC transporter permease [Xanthobacteraceae bacterium]